ncbi:hypothetical protein K8P03_03815 [Anaerococcus murdochii]|uniref:Uncharacterized protein n=1 Tax=Anaerococcus murdochii TaxID=411577 RepID=A0ABS7SY10_9FIRM|nr:hypothetical protein [Anaerococcus murdochii]MBZ2386429.1 hypothetical protein [Anaerococcus murdochii]
MKRPIDRFKGKTREEIEAKEDLLDRDNLERGDKLAMFLAAMRVFMPFVLLLLAPIFLIAFFM